MQLALEIWVYIAEVAVVVVSKTSKSSLYALTVKCDQRSRGLDDVFGRLPRSTLLVLRAMTVVVAAVCIDAWRMCVREVWGTSPWAEYALRCYWLKRAGWYCGGEKGVGVCTEGESGGRLVNRYKGGTYPSTAITTATLLYLYTQPPPMPPLYRDRYWWRGGDMYIGVR